MRKTIISLVLCVTILVCSFSSVYASNSVTRNGVVFVDNTIESVLTESEAAAYDCYELDISALPVAYGTEDMSVREKILSVCNYVETKDPDDQYPVAEYSSDILANYLPNCKEIRMVYTMGSCLYIYYIANDGKDVTLSYMDEGLYNKVLYDATTDIAIYDAHGSTTMYKNFRAGSHFEMTDELLDTIDELTMEENWDELSNLPGLTVERNDEGAVSIEPILPSRGRVTGFSTETAMRNHLNSKFPQYSDVEKASFSKYSKALGKNIPIKVKESRNNY